MNAKPLNLDNIRRILVLQLRQIGDVLLSTPSIELLHRRFPEAEIDVVTEIKCAPMLENNPHVHAIRRLDKSRLGNPLSQMAWYRKVGQGDYDLLIDFQQLPRCRWITFHSDARIKLTYTPAWWKRCLYTHWADNLPGYTAESKASILRLLGIEWKGEPPRLYLYPEELEDAAFHLKAAGLRAGQRLVTLDVTHKDPARRWPARHYAELLEAMVKSEPDLRFLFTYGPGEKDQTEAVRALYKGPDVFLNVPPTSSPRGAGAYIAHAAMHLGNCSAPRHMAAALDVPSFTILGASEPQWTSPDPIHTDIGAPHEQRMAHAREPERHSNARVVREAVLAHLNKYGKGSFKG